MKKRLAAGLLAGILLLTGCGNGANATTTTEKSQTTTQAENSTTEPTASDVNIRAASLKGPTTIGLLKLMEDAKAGKTANTYTFTMATTGDEIVPKLVKGELDIAAIPANLAAVVNQKTKGGITVIDINTLGVLYVVENSDQIKSFSDLKGKTIYMTGKGTVPEYTLNYLLKVNHLTRDNLKVEFKSEPTEVAALLQKEENVVGLLPQPFVTVASMQNDKIKVALDLTKEWDKAAKGSSLVTGVTVVRNDFLAENKEAVDQFLKEHQASAEYANSNLEETAALCEAAGIVKAPVAKKAIPSCNVVCLTGSKMQEKLSGYLKTLYDQDPKAVGGSLPDESFYYIP